MIDDQHHSSLSVQLRLLGEDNFNPGNLFIPGWYSMDPFTVLPIEVLQKIFQHYLLDWPSVDGWSLGHPKTPFLSRFKHSQQNPYRDSTPIRKRSSWHHPGPYPFLLDSHGKKYYPILSLAVALFKFPDCTTFSGSSRDCRELITIHSHASSGDASVPLLLPNLHKLSFNDPNLLCAADVNLILDMVEFWNSGRLRNVCIGYVFGADIEELEGRLSHLNSLPGVAIELAEFSSRED
ncbi:hypothetical protein IW261DRAFT_1425297 [Armillaria novae-zelandiae]|uniref:Uncharacterized protein n=1 Tax=Armillaria novae-zelandiae TaxID=153914 RepID=A0AA39NT24_9AGAR|nr:hypothetical protein IW261DRAFT_1425297 [Armillaria novae-zelandiae]